ncbi:MAG: hypothetical protein OXG24_04470 [Gammaproteobacteria bacterium]|nr:hypothetical protein [Gammaproteobacteria bacterium]
MTSINDEIVVDWHNKCMSFFVRPENRSMKTWRAFCVIKLLSIVFVLHSGAQVLEGPNGPVEFIGLQQWNASDLFKAIQELEPDKPFHACAATMKTDLGFSDAAAIGFLKDKEDGTREVYTIVVGVEESEGVQYRTPGTETVDLPETWHKLQNIVDNDPSTLDALVQARYIVLADPEATRTYAEQQKVSETEVAALLAQQLGANSESVDEVQTLVEALKEESNFRLALDVLARDTSWSARAVASVVLGHFPKSEASWHGLAGSLIDPHSRVRGVAERVLEGLIRINQEDSVNWKDARDTLLAFFSGTNPFGFNDILSALVATEVDPEFGQMLVREKPDILLAFAGAEHEGFSKPAREFLEAISGEDFGEDNDSWKAWLEANGDKP